MAFNNSVRLGQGESAVIGFQFSEEGDGQVIPLELAAGRHSERPGGRLQFRGKIFEGLIHIHTQARDSDVTFIAGGSTFHEDAGNLAIGQINIVRWLD